MLLGLSGLAWFAFAGNDDGAHADVAQGFVDLLFAVAAVGGDSPWCPTGAVGDPLDGGSQLWGVGGVALLDGVVQDDAVVVVGHLGLVAELDRLAEAALGDRARVRVVQADPAGGSGWRDPGESLPGLRGDLSRRSDQLSQIVDRPGELSATSTRDRITLTVGLLLRGLGSSPPQGSFGVGQHLLGAVGGGLSQIGQLAGDPTHRGLCLVLAGSAAHPQLGADGVSALAR